MTLLVEMPKMMSDEAFLSMPDIDEYELVDGRLVERKLMGVHANFIAAHVTRVLGNYAIEHRAGALFSAEQIYRCFNTRRTFRRPDVSFIRSERLSNDHADAGYFTIVPDLIVEVVSPNDLAEELEEKLLDYAEANVPLVWILYPTVRMIRIHRGDGTSNELRVTGTITGEAVLPGFSYPVADLFPVFPPTR